MDSDKFDEIDEIANDLDELKTTVEELEEQPPPGVEQSTLDPLRRSLEQASDEADELEDQKE